MHRTRQEAFGGAAILHASVARMSSRSSVTVESSPTWILGLLLQGRPPSAARFRPNPLDHIAAPGGTHSSGRSQQATVRCSAFSSLQVGFSVELRTRNRERCGGVCVSTILPESCGSEDIVTILSNRDGPANGCQPARRVAMRRPRVGWFPSLILSLSALPLCHFQAPKTSTFTTR